MNHLGTEIVQGVALSVDFIHRMFTNQYERRETNRIWNASGSALALEGSFRNGRNQTVSDLGTPDAAKRRYTGMTLGISKREGPFKAHASYTLSSLVGNVFNGADNRFGDIAPRDVYLWGSLPDDHRHEIKFTGQYAFTIWLSTGVRYTYFSGLPYDRLFRNGQTGSFEDYRAGIGIDPGANINDPGDDRTLRRSDLHSVNTQVRVNLHPLIGQRIDFWVDVLNVLALRTVTAVGQEDGRTFGVSESRMAPFQIRLTAQYKY